MDEIKENYGLELILDLHECNVDTFTRACIQDYCEELCRIIDMEACEFHFWDDEGVPEEECQTDPKTYGVSAVQFILTSSIVIHTLPKMGAAYINIFSCKDFDNDIAKVFTEQWFGSKKSNSTSVVRE